MAQDVGDLLASWLIDVGVNWVMAPKCSECWSTEDVYQTKCCSKKICGSCIQKYIKDEGWWVFRHKAFSCPYCQTKINI